MPTPATFLPDSAPASFVPDSPVSNANPTPINPDLLRGVPMPGAPVDYITAAKLAWATEGKPPSGFLRSDEEILADKIAKASLTGEEMKALSLSDFPAAALEGLGVSPGIATELGTQAFGPAAFGLQKKKLPAWAAPIERGGVAGLGGLADPANTPYLSGGLLSQAVGRILGAVFLAQGTTGAASDVGQGVSELVKGNTEKGLEDISRGGTIAATFYGPGAVSKLRKGGELHGQEKGQESRQELPLTRPTEIQPVEGKLPLTPPAEVPKTFVPEPVPGPQIAVGVPAKPGQYRITEEMTGAEARAAEAKARAEMEAAWPQMTEAEKRNVGRGLPARFGGDAPDIPDVPVAPKVVEPPKENKTFVPVPPAANVYLHSSSQQASASQQQEVADALDLKPEPSWPGLPGWGFSPKNTTEVGTFYVPEGASVEQVRAARDAKFELFKQENQKHEQTKAAARTEVPAASESVPEAVPTEREAAGQAVEAKVTPESTGLSVDDQAFALLHDLKGVATIVKGNAEKGVAKLTQEQGLDFQAEGDKIYEDYLSSGDYQAADAAVRALKDRVVAATKETPTAPSPQAVAGEPTPKEAKTIDVLSKTKPEYLNEEQAARLKALRSKFPGYVPKDIELPSTQAPTITRELNRMKLSPDSQGRYDGMQLYNTLRNRPGMSAEIDALDASGFKKWLSTRKPKAREVQDWIEANGPRVEVRKFGAASQTVQQKEMRELEHKLDTLSPAWRVASPNDKVRWPSETRKLHERWERLYNEGGLPTPSSEQTYWSSIAPKSEKDMPEYTELAVVKPIKRIVSYEDFLKRNKYQDNEQAQIAYNQSDASMFQSDPALYESEQFSSSHSFPPNTLVFTRFYTETLPSGKKAINVVEVQRDLIDQDPTTKEYYIVDQPKLGRFKNYNDAASALQNFEPLANKDYNRLALKAVIEHAREKGIDNVILPDAETAMMTEGHDAAAHWKYKPSDVGRWALLDKEGRKLRMMEIAKEYDNQRSVEEIANSYEQDGELSPGWSVVKITPEMVNAEISQEPGMRLNYDTILPRIAEELTGAKGERVSLGEHKNAYELQKRDVYEWADAPNKENVKREQPKPRQNLIFKNPDGTPKTDVSGLMYPLAKTRSEFSFFGKDKPEELQSPSLAGRQRVGSQSEEVSLKNLGIGRGTVAFDALQRLASQPDVYGKQNSALADFLTRHFGSVLQLVTIDPYGVSDRGRPSFLPHAEGNLLGEVRLGVGAEKKSGFTIPERLLHEGAHAATWWSFEHPTTEAARSARLKMEQLLGESKKRWQPTGNRDLDYQMRYYHQNPHEFIAGIFNSWEMRDHLNSFKLGERSAWEQIKDVVKTLLGVKPGTALDQAFDALIESQSEPPGGVRSAYPKEYLEAPAPGDPLPFRFKPYAEEKADVQARGIGKVPLIGKLFDPRAKRTLPEEKVILANSISKQKADSAIALWLETKKGEPRPFVPDEQGRIEFLNKTHGYMSDAIEAELRVPGSQSLTPEQRAFVSDWKEKRDEAIAYAQSEGVKFFLDSDGNPRALDEGYFPRPRIGTRGEPATPKGIGVGARPGSKQGPMKERYYDTEAEGAKAGVLYEPDPYLREADWLRAVYRSIADARLAKDAELKGRAGIRLVPARDAVTGIQIPGAFQIVGKGPKYGESEVYGVPALKGKVFPADIAKKLSEFYTSQPNKYARFAANVNDTLKGFKFAADVSAPLNQGLPLMSYNPRAWAKATVLSYGAFLEALVKRDTTVPKKYLENPENLRAAQTMVENGSSLFRLQDFLTGTQKGHFAAEFPVPVIGPPLRQTLGRAVRAGGESMGTFLSIAKIEAFKALEPLAKKNGTSMADLTEIVDNLVLSGRMEQIGVGQGRALTERLLFNAPSYLRAFVNVVANAAQGGMEGSVARRSIIGLLTSVSLQAYLAYKLSGMSEDEIKERMTPGSSKFLRFQYRIDKEKSVELSYGNIFLSFARLLGDTWEIATGKKSLRPGVEGNPWLRWLSYRKSPVVDLVQQVYSGRDYRGMPSGALQSLGRAAAPIPLEPVANVVAGTESRKQGAIEFGTQFLGGNAYPKNSRSMDEIARDKFGRPISQLNARERLAVAKERASTSKPSLDEQQMIEKAASEREFENRRKIVAGLPKEQRDFIEKYSLSVPGFQASYEKNRLQMPITPEERDLHLAAVQREYQVAIARLISSGRIEQFAKDGTLQRRLNVVLTDARERAMKDLKKELRRPR